MTGVKSRQYTNTKMIGKKINQLATELAPVSTDLTIIGDPTTGVSKKITLAQLAAIFSGAVGFYTNFASFPPTGSIDVIYCAKDTQKLYLWSGSEYVQMYDEQDKNYIHNQISASSTWNVTHNLNKYASVTIVDSGNNIVIGDVQYVNQNSVIITFNSSFSGKAFFN